MTFKKLSPKQKKIFKWCYSDQYKAIVCDGAVRSGKTVCMITSYILWAMHTFNGANFGICGKTIASAERNIVHPLEDIVDITAYFKVKYKRGSQNAVVVEGGGVCNTFYVFGGKDQSSYQLLQGITLSGIFFDEVALMPENFVQQGLTRCLSVENAKYWFNCNPESPNHWFYQEWILEASKRNALHLHFLMNDNPIISEKQLKEAELQFSGVFYERYILGLWVLAEGLIYPMYKKAFAEPPQGQASQYVISIDYGTLNAFAAILWGKYGDVWYAVDGYYYSGRDTGVQMTDEEYGNAIDEKFGRFLSEWDKLKMIVDPSAASFITLMKKKKRYKVVPADNAVVDGIRETATAIQTDKIKINPNLDFVRKEFEGYVWDDNPVEDKPVKVNDHCLTGDTLVMTENGEKPISDLVGTTGKVWSYNVFTGEKELKQCKDCRLTQKQSPIWELKTASGKTIKGTIDHLILTKSGWLELGRCMFENIQMVDGNFEKVVSIRAAGYENVYNMEVEDNHNFAVNGGFIVHNCMDSIRYFVKTARIVQKRHEYTNKSLWE